jgi:hypothetical protein
MEREIEEARQKDGGRLLWACSQWARQQDEAAPNSSLLSPDVPSLMMLPAPTHMAFFHANVTALSSLFSLPHRILLKSE